MKAKSALVVLLTAALLSACAPGTAPDPAPSVSSSATPTPTTHVTVAGFLLGATHLTTVDARGAEIEQIDLVDASAVISALTDFYGAPESTTPAEPECPFAATSWAGTMLTVSTPVTGGSAIVLVKDASFGIQPTVGPGFGEPVAEFVAGLTSDEIEGESYLYDALPSEPDSVPIGGVARFSQGVVVSIASPWPLGFHDICG